MNALTQAASRIARVLALLGAIAVVVMMLHICLDVVLRNLFRYSFSSTNAMVARYYMVPLAFLPLAYIELRDEMVSVELIDSFLPPWLRQLSDALVAAIACGIYGTLAWATWGSMVSNWRRGTMIELGDTNRACIALAEFSETYPALAAGRLQGQYEANRGKVKCD